MPSERRPASRPDKPSNGHAFVVVDIDRVLAETDHGKTAMTSLKALIDRTSATRDELIDKLQKAAGSVQKKSAQKELLEFDAERKKHVELHRQALRSALVGLVTTVIQGYARESGAAWVIERRAALAHPPEADVTDEIVRRVNAVRAGSGTGARK